MTAERDIDYEALAQAAMRGLVRNVLARVAQSGLPAEHHFYIAFDTNASGVSISPRLKEKYPDEMTIVLQHRFWDLAVGEDQFSVKLTFDGIPERLVVPFTGIKVFFDPSVPYGLQFEESDLIGDAASQISGNDATPTGKSKSSAARSSGPGRAEKKPKVSRKSQSETPAKAGISGEQANSKRSPRLLPSPPDDASAPAGPKVVNIDAFRKKS
jgi:uncharacterized protein